MKINGITIRRSYIETPIMDERKWEKIPRIPADVVLGDLEDSCPPDLKEKARDKLLALIKDASSLGAGELICRPNGLDTPWGRDDLEALAEARAPYVLYPKVRTPDEICEVKSIFDRHHASPEIMLIIETPQAVLDLPRIAACPGVTGLLFGYGDYAVETGTALIQDRHLFSEGFVYARTKMLTVARALGLEAAEGLFVADLKDLSAAREAVETSRMYGFTAMAGLYPPHIPIINEIMTPTADEVRRSKRVVEACEQARQAGVAAPTLDGRPISTRQYEKAKQTLAITEALGNT